MTREQMLAHHLDPAEPVFPARPFVILNFLIAVQSLVLLQIYSQNISYLRQNSINISI